MPSYWYDAHPRTAHRHDQLPGEADVVVVGAGLTGLTTALLLSRAGKQVVVLEARSIGAVTTGHTTGKVSLLQGTKLSRILGKQSEKVARAYLEANREGQAWLLEFCDTHDVPTQVRDAATFAASPEEQKAAQDEHRAASRLGLGTRWVEDPDFGFETYGATVLADQAQIDPAPVLAALAAQVTDHGGVIREGSRVVSVSKVGRPVVRTEDGAEIRCDDVVLATGTPILDRGLYFAKVEAHRSYVLVFDGATPPATMLLSAGSSGYSVREIPGPDGSLLMVGGKGHVVGRTVSEARRLDELRIWAAERFGNLTETHAWSAQDYSSHDGIPYVGKLPRGQGHVWVATGYDKWGLSNGVAAALRITGGMLGKEPSWALPMGRRITRPSGAFSAVSTNAKVGFALAAGLVKAELRPAVPVPEANEGVVGRAGADPVPVATSTVDGRTCSVVGLCTHLGGVLKWNDSERSWDCPLHGSRFAPDGTVLEGPATRNLPTKQAGARPQPEGVSTQG